MNWFTQIEWVTEPLKIHTGRNRSWSLIPCTTNRFFSFSHHFYSSLSLSISHTQTHTPPLPLSLFLPSSLLSFSSPSPLPLLSTFSLSHTHTHAHTHTHTHSLTHSLTQNLQNFSSWFSLFLLLKYSAMLPSSFDLMSSLLDNFTFFSLECTWGTSSPSPLSYTWAPQFFKLFLHFFYTW